MSTSLAYKNRSVNIIIEIINSQFFLQFFRFYVWKYDAINFKIVVLSRRSLMAVLSVSFRLFLCIILSLYCLLYYTTALPAVTILFPSRVAFTLCFVSPSLSFASGARSHASLQCIKRDYLYIFVKKGTMFHATSSRIQYVCSEISSQARVLIGLRVSLFPSSVLARVLRSSFRTSPPSCSILYYIFYYIYTWYTIARNARNTARQASYRLYKISESCAVDSYFQTCRLHYFVRPTPRLQVEDRWNGEYGNLSIFNDIIILLYQDFIP